MEKIKGSKCQEVENLWLRNGLNKAGLSVGLVFFSVLSGKNIKIEYRTLIKKWRFEKFGRQAQPQSGNCVQKMERQIYLAYMGEVIYSIDYPQLAFLNV